MANFIFNIAKGRDRAYFDNVNGNSPANSGIVFVLLQANEADDTVRDYTNLSTLIAAAGNTEATFTTYTRKVLTDTSGITLTINNTTNVLTIDTPDVQWLTAGGTQNNTLTRLLVCYDPDTTAGTDADIIPIYSFDFAATTNGNTLTAQVNAAGLSTQ